jgi:hypothetical protein
MIVELIANTAPAAGDQMISAGAVTAILTGITALVTGVIGAVIGKKQAQATKLEPPVPEVPTRKVSTPPTYDAHRALVERVSRLETDMQRMGEDVKTIRHEQAAQFTQLMTAGAERQLAISEKLEAMASSLHTRINELIINKRPSR